MKKFYIIRHAESQTNAGGEALPNKFIPITEKGQKQAQEVAEWVLEETAADIDSIGVSHFIRTHQTAQPLLIKTGMQATVIDDLHEFSKLSFLRIEGKSVEERLQLMKNYWFEAQPDEVDGIEFSLEENPPEKQGESFIMFANRAKNVLEYFKTVGDGTHVIYTHGMWISMLIWRMLNQPIDSQEAMQKFHDFELALRPKNTEVFLLEIKDANHLPAITKVRTL